MVVSDGSTDRTAAIARGYPGVDVVEFPANRGYGAAIKAGWERGGGELLGFLDADGTCDPRAFVPMCQVILEKGSDLVLGNRMGAGSRMPRVRRLGNVLYALLLGRLSRRQVGDTASGMRVVRRDALPKLLPLPDGLHFTPAMSAWALMEEEVKIAEVPIPYRERVGKSKLRLVRDGLRFLEVILAAAAYVRVSRLTVPIMAALGIASALLLAGPASFYARHGRLEEWMFYRAALAAMLATTLVIVLCATIVSEHVIALAMLRYERYGRRTRGAWRYENLRWLIAIASALWLLGAGLNLGGLRDLLTRGQVTLHWSRVLLGSFFSINLALLLATFCTLKIIRALHQRQPFLRWPDGGA